MKLHFMIKQKQDKEFSNLQSFVDQNWNNYLYYPKGVYIQTEGKSKLFG